MAPYPITEKLRQKILHFIHLVDPHAEIPWDDLCYLQLPFFGFDDQPHTGELIVHRKIVKEVETIFLELFQAKFPIEKMRLIEEYGADDTKSMEDNNTSSFCYRFAVGKPNTLSKHSFGLAIDVNPLYNPYVKQDLVLPSTGRPFTNRSQQTKGMIQIGDPCHTAFCRLGWTWGGSWPDRQDYHHFEREL